MCSKNKVGYIKKVMCPFPLVLFFKFSIITIKFHASLKALIMRLEHYESELSTNF